MSRIIEMLIVRFPALLRMRNAHLQELLTAGSAALVLKVTGMALSYGFTLLVTRQYGAETMGVFSLAFTLLSICTIFSVMGLDSAILRFMAEYTAQGKTELASAVYRKARSIMTPAALIISLLLFVLSPLIAERIFHNRGFATGFRIAAVAVLPASLVVLNAQALRALKRIRESIFFQNLSSYLFGALFLLLLQALGDDRRSPIAAYVVALVLGAIVSSFVVMRRAGPEVLRPGTLVMTTDILSVSLPMLLASSMLLVSHWTDVIMLGMFRSSAEVGVYSVALKMAAVIIVPLMAINAIATPKFAELHGTGDRAGFEAVIRQSTKLIFLTSFPIVIVLMLFSGTILSLFGETFRTGSVALVIVAAGQLINALCGTVGGILVMTGRQRAFQHIMTIATVINVALNIVLIPRYGMNGAAVSNAVSIAFWNLTSAAYIKKHLGITTVYFPFGRSERSSRR